MRHCTSDQFQVTSFKFHVGPCTSKARLCLTRAPSAAKKKRAYRITYTLYVYMHTNFPIQLQRISKQIHDAQEPFIMHNRTRHFAEYAQLQSEPTTRSCLTQTGTSCSSDLPPVQRDALYCLRRSCQDNLSIHVYGETSCGLLSRRAETDGLA